MADANEHIWSERHYQHLMQGPEVTCGNIFEKDSTFVTVNIYLER